MTFTSARLTTGLKSALPSGIEHARATVVVPKAPAKNRPPQQLDRAATDHAPYSMVNEYVTLRLKPPAKTPPNFRVYAPGARGGT